MNQTLKKLHVIKTFCGGCKPAAISTLQWFAGSDSELWIEFPRARCWHPTICHWTSWEFEGIPKWRRKTRQVWINQAKYWRTFLFCEIVLGGVYRTSGVPKLEWAWDTAFGLHCFLFCFYKILLDGDEPRLPAKMDDWSPIEYGWYMDPIYDFRCLYLLPALHADPSPYGMSQSGPLVKTLRICVDVPNEHVIFFSGIPFHMDSYFGCFI